MRRLFTTLAALMICNGALSAETHGPILQWYQDPSTTMTFHWLERNAQNGIEGEWTWGQAGFGYGDDDDTTSFPKMRNRFRSIYLRRTFDLRPAHKTGKMTVRVTYDDSFILYLNGKEILRKGVDGSGKDIKKVAGHEAKSWEKFELPVDASTLKDQGNVIAVEVHNERIGSSDLSFDMELLSKTKDGRAQIIPAKDWWQYLANKEPEKAWHEDSPKTPASKPDATRFTTALQYRQEGQDAWTTHQKLESRAFGDSDATVVTADLSGLKPGAKYEFKLTGTNKKGWFQTAPSSLSPKDTFVTGGDMFHTRELLDAMNRRAGKEDPLFALLGGDLAYANGVSADRWYEWMDSWQELAVSPKGRTIPMVVAIGNHEVKGVRYMPKDPPPVTDAQYFYSLFKLPQGVSNYELNFGKDLLLVMLDSGHTQSIASQNDWLESTFKQHRDAKRTFVCYHRPAYGTGVKGDAIDIRQQWSPLFEKYGVEAVFENDHHTYKRTKPLINNKEAANGVIYMGDGAWGTNLRKIDKKKADGSEWLDFYGEFNHLIRVTLGDEKVEYDSMEANGNIFDRYSQKPRP